MTHLCHDLGTEPWTARGIDAGGGLVRFDSILFPGPEQRTGHETRGEPDFFRDLNLDQVANAIAASAQEYDLAPFYYGGPLDLDTIAYRQDIMRELEQAPVLASIHAFAASMRTMRQCEATAQPLSFRYEKQRWLLRGIQTYCDGVQALAGALHPLGLRSRGLRSVRTYVADYAASQSFRELAAETTALVQDLAAVRYSLVIKDTSIAVQPYGDEGDYTTVVEQIFAKFRHGAVKDYRITFADAARLNHVEEKILARVAWLQPAVFAALDAFCTRHAGYVDERLARFDREIQFYVAYLAFIDPLRRVGLPFCYPRMSDTSKELQSRDAFDLALAAKLVAQHEPVVCNDFVLRGIERVFVVSGPNQGGKTTFARMFGQLHYLASLGCPVPGSEARLFLCDRVFVHFERAEAIEQLRGKLQDDLIRIRHILDQATPRSIIIMNELFSSTTLEDAIYLSQKVMACIVECDTLTVCVTFLDGLTSFSHKTVSVVSTVDPHDPAVRTFRIERRPANGLAYALAIADKHRVTYDWLTRRLSS
jgi:DNA mismatch repair protein MutS